MSRMEERAGNDKQEKVYRIFEEIAADRPDVVCSITVDDGFLASSRIDAETIVSDAV